MYKITAARASVFMAAIVALTLTASTRDASGFAPAIESVYTDLNGSKCRTTSTDAESASSEQRCPGIGGYGLEVLDGDSRMSINVIAPGGKSHPLNLWTVVSSAFSSVGDKAEWRVKRVGKKVVPIALIVRFKASENADNSNAETSYLTVAKITARQICVTDKIAPSPTANEEARRAADTAALRRCLPSP